MYTKDPAMKSVPGNRHERKGCSTSAHSPAALGNFGKVASSMFNPVARLTGLLGHDEVIYYLPDHMYMTLVQAANLLETVLAEGIVL